jgi:hypothetical protein
MIAMSNPNTKYNGWTNYDTWLCNLWFDNFEFSEMLDMFDGCEDKDDILRVIKNYIKDYVEEYVEESRENASGFINDLISSALGEIDYYDIAEHYVDDVAAELEANNTEENEVEMYPVDKDALVLA